MENATNFHRYLKKKVVKSLILERFSISRLNQARKLYFSLVRNEKRRKKGQELHNVTIPPLCMFSLTWNCNLSCKGCYAMNYKNGDTLKLHEIETIFRQLIDYGTYVFILAGGEPLTVKGLIPTIEKVNNGMYFMFTNGLLINEEIVRQLKRNQNIIPVISLEGEPYHTDHRRGNDVSAQLEKVFELLNKNKVTYGISSMATHLNYTYIFSNEYLNRIKKMGASFLYVIDYIPFDFSLNKNFILQKYDYNFKREELKKRMMDNQLTVFNFPADEYTDGKCEAGGKGFLHINANGYVEPCPFSHYAKDNILHKDYIDILKSDFLTEIRNETKLIENKTGNCLLFDNKELVEKIVAKTCAFSTEGLKHKQKTA